jgi:hypothetical protein
LASLACCFFTEGFAEAFLAGVLTYTAFFAGVAFLAGDFDFTGVSDFFFDLVDFLSSASTATFSALFF